MISMKPDKSIHTQKIKIAVSGMKNGKRYTRKIPVLILSPKDPKVRKTNAPGILWIHGGGLCAALCMLARDRGKVKIAYQMPLYPMLDNLDADTFADNHGRIWNTRRNHITWRLYVGLHTTRSLRTGPEF